MKRIAVFARWPEPGRVKTRLSPALTPGLAAELHAAMIRDAAALADSGVADRAFLYWADASAADLDPPLAGGIEPRAQRGASLGERLAHAFAELLPGREDRALVIGTDCPALNRSALHAAFQALERADLALGPTEDGGYHLIGLARPAPLLFEGIDWGTERVSEQTLARARAAALRVHTLETRGDVDRPEDLLAWIARIAVDAEAAGTHAAAALERMGLVPHPARAFDATRAATR